MIVWGFLIFLFGGPLLLWIAVSPYYAKLINHREWTAWARQDLRALATAIDAYRAAKGEWPPALANLTPNPEVRVSIPTKRSRHARPTPTPAPLPPDVAARTFIHHVPADPYAPGFDYPNGQAYQYAVFDNNSKSEIQNQKSEITYIVLSPGPDYTIEIDLSKPLDPAELPALAYDPTNGLVSGGDIFLTGPR